jgi:hypothetical protein
MKIFIYISAFLFVFLNQLKTSVFAYTNIDITPPVGKIPLPEVNDA